MSTATPTFVITGLVAGPHHPSIAEARDAYYQAVNTIIAQTELPYDEIYIGRHSDQLIHGVDRKARAASDTRQFCLHSGRCTAPEPNIGINLDDLPDDLLQSNCNSTTRIIALALNVRQNNIVEPLPTAVVTVGSHYIQQKDYHIDVFGQQLFQTTPTIASRFVHDSQPGYAQYQAHKPMKKLARAQFRCDFLRLMADHPDRLVVQFELWQD